MKKAPDLLIAHDPLHNSHSRPSPSRVSVALGGIVASLLFQALVALVWSSRLSHPGRPSANRISGPVALV